jgi:uncharacterized protein YnzC (UPF0291/DUF896 family)
MFRKSPTPFGGRRSIKGECMMAFERTVPIKVVDQPEQLTEEEKQELQQLRDAWRKALEKNYSIGMRGHAMQYLIKDLPQYFYLLRRLAISGIRPVAMPYGLGQEFTESYLAIDELLRPVKLHVRHMDGPFGGLVEASTEVIDPRDYDLSGEKVADLARKVIQGGES